MPEFHESYPGEFFLHFENVVVNKRKWPKDHWPALTQGTLRGKGR